MIDTCNNCKDFLNWRKDLELKLQAADALAKAMRKAKDEGRETTVEIEDALAAYEKARGMTSPRR